jgi:hypothetical protein
MSSKSLKYEEKSENLDGIPPEFQRTEKEIYLLSYLNKRKKIEDSFKEIREAKASIKKYLGKYPDLKSFVRGPSPKKDEKKKKEKILSPSVEEELKAKAEKKRLGQKRRREKKKEEKRKKEEEEKEKMAED